MALLDPRELQVINQTVEALSSCERRRLFYLCEILDTDNSVACMKEMLKSKVMFHERGHLFLEELMLRLKRFDILRKVYKTSGDEVERTLKHRQVLPRFRVLMANINEDMADEDLNNVKFLLSTQLPREKMEKAKSFLDVIIELEKLDKVSPERVDVIEQCLRDVDRVDLAKKVTAYKMSEASSASSPARIKEASWMRSETSSRIFAYKKVGTSEGHQSQQQRHRHPDPFPAANSSRSLQQTRPVQSLQMAPGSLPTTVYREQNYQRQVDCYKFNTNPRGVCVIIDCVGNDGDMLEQTFKALHFNVVLHKWLSADGIYSALNGIRENLEGDGFVCCIISRGPANHVLGTDSYATGLGLEYVRRLFTADKCPKLAGKPKLFFIQRYSVPEYPPCARMQHRDEDLETDGCDGMLRCDFIPTDADIFWSHCWTDEYQLGQGHHRSIYLKALTDTLHKGQKRKTHLVDVHTEVNGAIFEHNKRNLGEKYHIDLKHTLRKELYLQ